MRAVAHQWRRFNYHWHRWRGMRAANALAFHVAVEHEIRERRRVERIVVDIAVKMEGDE